jgi:hypothetical protein
MKKTKTPAPPTVGRPLTVAGRRRNIYIDDDLAELAEKIGAGNMSEGIREALKAFKVK